MQNFVVKEDTMAEWILRKYSSIFWWLILFGVVSVIFTISSIVEHLPVPTAIGSICTFIFFWVSLMLDDADKYKRYDR